MSNKPEIVFKAGAVRASIFQNTFAKNGVEVPIYKVVLEVRYKDKSGQWQGTNSLSLNEVPKAILALQKAYEFLTSRREPLEERESAPAPPSMSRTMAPAPYAAP